MRREAADRGRNGICYPMSIGDGLRAIERDRRIIGAGVPAADWLEA